MAKIPSDTQWSDLAAKVKAKQDALAAGTGIDATELASDVVEIDNTVVVYEEDTTPGTNNFLSVMMDYFYPVGSYYETSDELFDPNTEWGGTWVEDSAGRVLVAKDTGTFATVGDTGGNEQNTHQHWQTNGADNGSFFDLRIDDNVQVSGLETRVLSAARVRATGTLETAGTRQHTTYNETIDILQPYVVVKRWHRTA